MFLTNTTTAHQYQLQLQHDKGWLIYDNVGTLDEVLKNQVIDIFEGTYLKELKNKDTGFLVVMCHNLLEHILDQYINITTADLKSKNQWVNEPIEV